MITARLAETGIDPRWVASLRTVSRVMSMFVLAVGGLVLIGWQLDIVALTSGLRARVAMNPLAALGFVAGAGWLWLRQVAPATTARRAAQLGAGLVIVIGGTTLIGYLVGDNLGLDQIMYRERLGTNRIAPNTGLNFLLIGATLLLLDWETRSGHRPAQLLALVPTAVALTSVLGYAYDVGELYGFARYIPMALPTAVAFLALGLGIACARPERGFVSVMASTHAGGVLARRLLPAAVLIPTLLGWLRLVGQRAGLFAAELGLASAVVANSVLCALLSSVPSGRECAPLRRDVDASGLGDPGARGDEPARHLCARRRPARSRVERSQSLLDLRCRQGSELPSRRPRRQGRPSRRLWLPHRGLERVPGSDG